MLCIAMDVYERARAERIEYYVMAKQRRVTAGGDQRFVGL